MEKPEREISGRFIVVLDWFLGLVVHSFCIAIVFGLIYVLAQAFEEPFIGKSLSGLLISFGYAGIPLATLAVITFLLVSFVLIDRIYKAYSSYRGNRQSKYLAREREKLLKSLTRKRFRR